MAEGDDLWVIPFCFSEMSRPVLAGRLEPYGAGGT